jgi:alpha-1,6-mannosyltransferase
MGDGQGMTAWRPGVARLIVAASGVLACTLALAALAPLVADERTARLIPVLAFAALAALAGSAWLAALPAITMVPPLALAAFGLALRLPWVFVPPVLDTDFLRYLWDGALVAHGLSPWAAPPSAGVPAALGEAGVALAARLSFSDLRSIYPAAAQGVFALAHLLAPWSITGLRLVMLGAEICTIAVAWGLLRRCRLPVARAWVLWCCPLVPVVLINAVHVEAVLVPLLLGAVWATVAARGVAAGALLGLAVGVKVWPLLLAPLIGRTLPRRGLAAAAAALALTAGLSLAPLLGTLGAADAGLASYARGWHVNNAPFAWAEAILGMVLATPGAVLRPMVALAAGLVALAVAVPPHAGGEALIRRAMIVGAVTFYLSPAQFPWYAMWFMPFAALLSFRPLLLPAAALPAYWLFFPLHGIGQGALFNHGVSALHALPVAVALLLRWR